MSDLNAALWPVFLIILLGYGLSARGFPAKGFWPQAEKLTYYVLFPALLIDNLSGADMIGLPVFGLGLVLALATVAVALVVILLRERMPVADGPAFTSLFQGSIRMNTYVASPWPGHFWSSVDWYSPPWPSWCSFPSSTSFA